MPVQIPKKQSAHVVVLAVESRCSEMDSCAQRLKQNMRNEFRVQLMKLPVSVRKMPVSEFCDVFNADINVIVSAEEIKAKTKVAPSMAGAAVGGGGVPGTGTKRGRVKNVDLADALQGRDVDEQMRFLEHMRSQIDAYASQLKVAKG